LFRPPSDFSHYSSNSGALIQFFDQAAEHSFDFSASLMDFGEKVFGQVTQNCSISLNGIVRPFLPEHA
jgi:hypothetical protein